MQPSHDINSYFDTIYTDNSDPWQYESRWYEQRKRDVCLALLLQPQYQNAIELGCSNGVFSERLATRCHHLTCIDGHPKAVELAKQRLAQQPHVKVIQGLIPAALPQSSYDLIVISEILYYLALTDIEQVISWLKKHLVKNGTLLVCHWRYSIDGFSMDGNKVHELLRQELSYAHHVKLCDTDFLVDLWRYGDNTVAMDENLI